MEITLANYSLPAMCQVVCTLVAAGISGVEVRNTVPNVTQPPPQYQPPTQPPLPYQTPTQPPTTRCPVTAPPRLPTLPPPENPPKTQAPEIQQTTTTTTQKPKTTEPPRLPQLPPPDGYVQFPDIGFAYKVYDTQVTWIEARDLCVKDGAKLALIDSRDKLAKIKTLKKSSNFVHVGIVRMFDGKIYVAVSTGSTLTSSVVPWARSEPNTVSDCVDIDFAKNGLGTYACLSRANYVCEYPIYKEDTLKAHETAYAVEAPPPKYL